VTAWADLTVFDYFSTSEIWPNKRDGIKWKGHYIKRGTTAYILSDGV
jgi:hypothetical protein